MFYLLGCFVKYANDRQLPVRITSVIRAKLSVSVSNTHAEGRAVDISCSGWSADQCLAAVEYFNDNYAHIGAISKETGKPSVLVWHEVGNNGLHFHLQCRR